MVEVPYKKDGWRGAGRTFKGNVIRYLFGCLASKSPQWEFLQYLLGHAHWLVSVVNMRTDENFKFKRCVND